MQVCELAREEIRREPDRGVSSRAIHLGQSRRSSGEAIVEVDDAVGRGIERGQYGRCRHLGPCGLCGGVVEEDPVTRKLSHRRRGRPFVTVRVEVILTQRVGPDDDDTLRHPSECRGGTTSGWLGQCPATSNDRRAPETDGPGLAPTYAERQRHVLSAESRQIDYPGLPAVRRRHRLLEQDLTIVPRASVTAATRTDRERDRTLVDRAQGEIEPRRRRHFECKLQPFGRA